MKDKILTVQLRSTIFLPQNIGYTPQNADKFKNALMPEGKIYGISQPSMPILGVNPNLPQYGMPWRIFHKLDHGEYNIAFQPGKIDIILAKEVSYNDEIEKKFCRKSIEWFSKILDIHGGITATRIAYAPLYAISNDDDINYIWNILLRKPAFNGIQSQDINLSFLLKRIINIGGKEIQINLLHNIFDGNKIKSENGVTTVKKVLMLQLDLNTMAEDILNLGCQDISEFFNNILEIRNKLIENVTE